MAVRCSTFAEATQYVDDNPLTKPLDQDQDGNVEYYERVTRNQTRLKYRHFNAWALGKDESELWAVGLYES